jgi:para-aminobenzoate synthetase component 1
MREIKLSADNLVKSLLKISVSKMVCFLDSGGVNHLESHLLIAGISPVETLNITNKDATKTLDFFNEKISDPNVAYVFTISYDFGLKLENIKQREKEFPTFPEPDIFLASFDCLVIHDYNTGKTYLTGNENRFDEIEKLLINQLFEQKNDLTGNSKISSNFSRESYIKTVEKIQEFIRRGDTYQTNLTQQIRAELPKTLTPQKIFWCLRKSHPAPFSAFIKRVNDFVVSISPERFFKVQSSKFEAQSSEISASPIKGTRQRGKTLEEDSFLKNELLTSEKDRAENVMIVDLLRNDIGRICKFGSVEVEKLCELETHPTLFHLVSTIRGELREDVNFAEIIKAVFPCGSITGAPKIRTMQIIDKLETANRGLSMGAIGFKVQGSKFKVQSSFDLSVAIRTMVIRNNEAIFNVGGGIVIDSEPEKEFEESLLKAKALLSAING